MVGDFLDFVNAWAENRVWLQIIITIIILVFITCVFAFFILILKKFYYKINSENKVLDIAHENTRISKENLSLNADIKLNNKAISEIYSKYIIDSKRIQNLKLNPDDENVDVLDIEEKGFLGSEIISENIDSMSHTLSNENKVRISVWQGFNMINESSSMRINLIRNAEIIEIFRSKNYTASAYNKNLNINKSIAGRVLRTNELQYSENIHSDHDFNNIGKVEYASILGIPIWNDLVIMYDFKEKPKELEKNLCLISGLITSYLIVELSIKLNSLRSEQEDRINNFERLSFNSSDIDLFSTIDIDPDDLPF